MLLAQQRTVNGVVVSADDNQPIIGASVIIKGTQTGVATDLDGKFRLSVPNSATLVVSFVGMKTQEVAARDGMRVVLQSDSKVIDEVMVVAYGTAKKSAFAGSAASVKADAFANAKVESLDKALAGKVPGLRVTSVTGDAGASGSIQVRGIGSITGSTQPLYVIDGVAMTSGNYGADKMSSNILSTINPDDIESMTVLKDAAAASLYGSRAANGVVVITTKKGQQGKTRFNLRANKGWSTMATDSYVPMTAAQYRQYFRDALVGYRLNQKKALIPGSANYGDAAVLAEAETFADANLQDNSPITSDEQVTNWRDKIYDGGFINELQLSASGGNEQTKFFASLGVNDTKGLVTLSTFRRYSSLLNLENKASKWLDLSFKSQISHTSQQSRGDQADQAQGIGTTTPLSLVFSSRPDQPVYNDNGTYNENASFDDRVKNPLMQLQPDYSKYDLATLRALTDVGARITFTDWLSFKTTNSVDYVSAKLLRRWSPNSLDGESVGGLGERTNRTIYTMSTSNVLSANKTLGEVHNLDGLVGFEAQKINYLYEFLSAKAYSNPVLPELASGQPDQASSAIYNTFLRSFFGNVNYNYADRYYLGASLRSDESSRLGVDKRQGIFYSVSGAWRFGNEEFFKNNLITDGKLRASFGTNGNLPGNYYGALGLYAFSGTYGGQAASFLSQVENKDLGWEQSRNFNLGLDLTFAQRFTFTVEYYNKYTDNLLLELPISYGIGLSAMDKNVGAISNKGIEVEFHGRDLLSSPFKWDLDLSLSTLKATVESLPNGDIISGDGNLYMYSEGKDLYSFYLPTWVGVNPQTGLGQFLKDPTKPADPDNLTHVYTQAGRTIQKSAYPKLFGGLTNTFSFKGFTLSSLITYQFGGYLFDYPGYFFKNDGVRMFSFNLDSSVAGNYWRNPGDVVDNPRPVLNHSYRSDRWSTRHLHSTDFVRLKELSLTYRIPESIYRKLGVSSVDVSLVANNLFFIYAATKDMELEVALNGYRTVDTPASRTFSIGLNVGF